MGTIRYGNDAKIYVDTTAFGTSTNNNYFQPANIDTKIFDGTVTGTITGFFDAQPVPKPKEQNNLTLYEYAVSYQPQDDEGNVIKAECAILTPPTAILAQTEESVRRTAIRDVTDATLDMDFLVVQVRPFGGR